MSTAQSLVIPLSKIDKGDVKSVGGKGANLGEMIQAGFPVPDGFAVSVAAYDLFFKENGLAEKIYPLLKSTDVNNSEELDRSSKEARNIILKARMPDALAGEIVRSYKHISGFFRRSLVAVRSSATAEDMPGTSFAGQQVTFLNSRGDANLLSNVRQCWASLFMARSIFYRVQNKIPHDKVKISVIVQKMIESRVSGVMFTINPVTNEKDRIVIEAVWGLGEMIVQGSVVPDKYTVQKETFSILSKDISDQSVQLIRKGEKTLETPVPKNLIGIQKISDDDIVKLAHFADKLQKHYFFPQDAEWAKDGKGKLYLVQTRPVTTITSVADGSGKENTGTQANTSVILTGISASPGVGSGPAKILKSADEIGKVNKGDVLVAPMTSPDFVPAMKKAVAIVTDEGGQTSHAAIVSRELGIPCVVGTKEATKKIKEGQIISVDGAKGLIFSGSINESQESGEIKKEKQPYPTHKTATKLYVNLAEPEKADEVAKKNVDGVGLLRAEFMIAAIGIHPKYAIKVKKQDKFIDKLAHDMTIFCRAFGDRPVVYRATDFKTNEYKMLEGGSAYEPKEPNPMLGFRGAYRYIESPETFALELRAIAAVREKHKNLHLMIPFVRSPSELARVRKIVTSEGLFADPSFRFLMMVELPVNVICLEDFIKVGIDGVSIGSNDLTMLLLGTDRDNSEVAQEFDERSEASLWALKRTINTCNKYGISSSICGQAPSVYDDLVEKLVSWGITGISVNPDAIDRVRNVIHLAEKKIVSKEKI